MLREPRAHVLSQYLVASSCPHGSVVDSFECLGIFGGTLNPIYARSGCSASQLAFAQRAACEIIPSSGFRKLEVRPVPREKKNKHSGPKRGLEPKPKEITLAEVQDVPQPLGYPVP